MGTQRRDAGARTRRSPPRSPVQYVDGLQGQNQNGVLPASANGYYKAIATLKHYAANNSEVNRRTGSSDMDQRTLREYYTAQFADIIEQAHPGLDHELLQRGQRRARPRRASS